VDARSGVLNEPPAAARSPAVRHVLVVCGGNTCRSPIAAALLVARAAEDGTPVEVRTAGTNARRGAPASPHALTVMAARGLDVAPHRAARLDAALLAWATDVWVMTARHRTTIARRWPDAAGVEVRLLSEAAGRRGDVADPLGGELSDYRRTADELAILVDGAWRGRPPSAGGEVKLRPDESPVPGPTGPATDHAAQRP
jgi:protein-tyrosine phosphatase